MTSTRCFERVPWLRSAGTPERLAGLTNLNYRIGEYVLRISGAGTSEYIGRTDEEVAARSAAAAGVNAEVVFFDAERRADGDALRRRRGDDDAGALPRDLGAIRGPGGRCAGCTPRPRRSPPSTGCSTMIDEYKALLASKSAPMPDGFDDVQAEAELGRAALLANPVPVAPCHCDPLCENFLDTGETMYLIDYEYAGNNDPMWDLGDLSVEAGFGAEQDAVLLDAYFDGEPPGSRCGADGDPQGDCAICCGRCGA